MPKSTERVEVEVGSRIANPGHITTWARTLKDAFNDAGKGARSASRDSSLLERAVDKLPPSFREAGSVGASAMLKVGRSFDVARDKAVGLYERASRGVSGLARSLTSLKTLVVGYLGYRFADSFLDVADNAERMRIALDQLTGGRGEEWFQRLNDWAFKMPLNTEKAIQAFIRMRAYGLEPTIAQMTTLVDSTIGVGMGEEALESVSRALGQIQAKGKVSIEELNQLAEAGINAKDILAKALGVPVTSLEKIIRKGVDADTAIRALFQGMEERFGGASSKIEKKFTGLKDALVSHWKDAQRLIMESGPMQFIETTLGRIKDKLDELRESGRLQDMAERAGAKIQSVLEKVVGWGGKVFSNWDWLESKWDSMLKTGRIFLEVGGQAVTIVTDMLSGVLSGWNALPTWMQGVGLITALLFGKKGAAVAAVGMAVVGNIIKEAEALEKIRAAGGSVSDWLNLDRDTSGLFGLEFTNLDQKLAGLKGFSGAVKDEIAEIQEQMNVTFDLGSQLVLEGQLKGLQERLSGFQAAVEAADDAWMAFDKRIAENQRNSRAMLHDIPKSLLDELGKLGAGSTAAKKPLTLPPTTDEKALKEKLRLTEWAQDKINKLTLSTSAYEFEQMRSRVAEMRKAGVEKVTIERYYQTELQGIIDKSRKEETAKADKSRNAELKAESDLRDQVKKLTSSDLEYQVWALNERYEAYRQSTIDQTLVEQAFQLELNEIYRKANEGRKGLMDEWYESWTDVHGRMRDISQSTFQTISDSIYTFWDDLVSKGQFSADQVVDILKSIPLRAAAQLATIYTTNFMAQGVNYLAPGLFNQYGYQYPYSTGYMSSVQQGVGLANYGAQQSGWFQNYAGAGLETTYNEFGMPGAPGGGYAGWTYGVGGIAGGLAAQYAGPAMFGESEYGSTFGSIGSMAGGIAGSYFGPWGTAGGSFLGGMVGQGLGSLLGGDDDDRDPWEIPGNYEAHWDRLRQRLEEVNEQQEIHNLNLAELAPLAAGAGDYLGNYGAILGGVLETLNQLTPGTEEYARIVADQLNPAWIIQEGLLQNINNGMDLLTAHQAALNDTIDALLGGSSLAAEQQQQLVDLLLAQSGTVEDLTAKYQEYESIREQLTQAHTLSEGELQNLIARGQELHKELGLEDSAMSNLNATINDLNEAIENLARSLNDLPANKEITVSYRKEGWENAWETHHTGGLVRMHTGGLAQRAMDTGLISMHGGGFNRRLRPDEVLRVLQLDEFVTRAGSVNARTLPVLHHINDTGEVPADAMPSLAVTAPSTQTAAPQVVTIERGDTNINVVVQVPAGAIAESGAMEKIKAEFYEVAYAAVADAEADKDKGLVSNPGVPSEIKALF